MNKCSGKLLFLLLTIFIVSSFLPVFARNATQITGENYEYVVITIPEFAGVFQKLADWKTDKGIRAKVVTTDFIKKNFRGDGPGRIREFVKFAYKNWGTRWVLLGGDTEGQQGEIIPVRYARSGIKNTDIPSDLYYAALDGNWNGNGNRIYGEFNDNVDLTPEVFIGRASVDTAEEASNFVEKVLNYEKRPPKNWVKKSVLCGAELDEFTFAERGAEILAKESLKGFKLKKFYHLRGSDAEKFKTGLDTFNPHIVYVGAHGNQQLFGFRKQFTNEHADSLKNAFPFIYTSISCLTNYFDKDSLSEHIMNNPKSGAVAYWACSREGWYQPRNEGYFYSILMVRDFLHLLFNDPKNVSNSIGQAAARARAKYIPEAKSEDSCFRWLVYGMNLLGCPEMPVWTSEPVKLNLSASEIRSNKVNVKVVASGKSVNAAKVAIRYFDDNTLLVTASAKNCIPVSKKIAFASPAGVYSVGKTSNNGIVTLSLASKKSIVNGLIQELIDLDAGVKSLANTLKKTRSNKKIFAKLGRDYNYLNATLARKRQEVRKFFIDLVENKNYEQVEIALDFIQENLKANPSAVDQFAHVLVAVSDKMRFKLAHLGNDQSDIQTRIFHKLFELKSKVSKEIAPVNHDEIGRLKVTSDPSGATVYLNNVPVGKTPCVVERVAFGPQVIKVKAQGLKDVSARVTINEKKTLVKHFQLAAGCKISGRVIFGDTKKPAKNVTVNVGGFFGENDSWKTLQEVKTDETGKYSFSALPKLSLYVEASADKYNSIYKPFLFEQRDQGFVRTWNIVLYPLSKLSGKVDVLKNAELRLFKDEKHGSKLFKEIKIDKTGKFSLEDLPLGKFRLIYTIPGRNLCVRAFHNDKGKDYTFNLSATKIQSVEVLYRLPGERFKWLEAKDNGKGVYEVEEELKASDKPYEYAFFLNYAEFKKTSNYTCVVNPGLKAKQGAGIVLNELVIKKDGKFKFAWDSNKKPVYYAVVKEDGKEVYVLSEESDQLKK